MRIKIHFNKDYKILRIPVVLTTPHKRVVSDFVLDTGSPHTILNYTDSLRLNIPFSEKAELIRIGGRTYQSYLFSNVEIVFKTTGGLEIKERIPVRVLKIVSSKISEIENLDRFPNLLGLDFLEKNYELFCNLKQNNAFIEKIG